MKAVRSKDTKPEMIIRRALHALGYRYRLHDKSLPGRPDLAFHKRSSIIDVRGCFWHRHGCPKSGLPSTRREWWSEKLERNVVRDTQNEARLREDGWKILTLWECEILRDPRSAVNRAVDFLGRLRWDGPDLLAD
jgi:DNA mismatch endonuclease Vsr